MSDLTISSQGSGTGQVLRFAQSTNYDNSCGLTSTEIDALNTLKDIQFDGKYWCNIKQLNLFYSPESNNPWYLYDDPQRNPYLKNPQITNATLTSGVWKLIQIESLDLGGQAIINIPNDIENLVNLKSLSLRGNPLSQLNTKIGNLTNLEVLRLDNKRCNV